MPLKTGRCATWCLAVWAATCGASRADAPPDDGKGAAARAILDAWHAASPEPGDRKLHVVAWRAKDRDFAPDHRARLDRILTHIQDFYRRELERHGLGPRSIRLDRDADGRLVVHEITGEAPWVDYDGDDGQRIRRECVPVLRERGIDADGETLMIFTNLAEWDPEKLAFRHKSPYYAGGNHRRGTAWQLDSAELDIANLAAQQPTVSDGQYGRISLGRHVSIFIGGIAHEMGHALGLPHCRERDDEAVRGTALMGSGNRTYGDELRGEGKGTFLTLAHALRLASHPQFSGSVKGLAQKAQATLTGVDVAAPDGRSFTVRGVVTGEPPVYAVVAYLDPAGSGDYDARTVTAVPDAAGRFTLDCTPLVADKVAELRLVACHANGATTRIMTQGYAVGPDGTVDVAALAATTGLTEFLDALDRGGAVAARAIHAGLPRDSHASRIAAAILAGRDPHRATRSPAETAADVHELPLSRATPAEARVGWLRPAYDHLPRRDALLAAVGRVYDAGIYAHAPALHRYDLARSWDRLRGSCGLADGTNGSVVCVVRVDGVETFRSRRLAAGDLQDFDLAVDGARTLELVVEDAGDGNHSDWAVWLAPRLTRGDAAAAR